MRAANLNVRMRDPVFLAALADKRAQVESNMEAKSREKPKKSAIRLCELIKEAY